MSTGSETRPGVVTPLAHGEALLARSHVCVLGGGISAEDEISLASARRIADALGTRTDAEDLRGPAEVSLVVIEKDGRWRLGDRCAAPPEALGSFCADVDLFFLGLHGDAGEDGTLQGFLHTAGRAFTGSAVAGSAVAMDKVFARAVLEGAGACVAPGVAFGREEWAEERSALCSKLSHLGQRNGWVVKPRSGGSSLGTTVVREEGELESAVATALAVEPRVLVEALVEGIEVTGAVLAGETGPFALPVVEIQPRSGSFFDYEEKYSQSGAREVCPPESLGPEECARVQELSLLAHRLLRCDGYSRSDFLVPRPSTGFCEPVFLELNTLPGMTERSLLPIAASAAGLDYRSLCLRIAALALAGRDA
ncbi:MAG TPA: D-alanine--D-alanine ligase [Planctomycetes bacterium]|nr:D-alanine--D-alanine ligase [Planctomycetota bacterium]